ncbi:hypothetical protein LWM68_25640 [Niabella sp. W65]|nr:hypothetical protein [Niabella sp. W65]MCH7365849.1 hypothetical protein [Niabella sp. W65]ULT41603.1 hypothetical protein KRR40_44570 [Niabella sp. I65]
MVIDSIAPVFSPASGDMKEISSPIAIQMTKQVHGKEQRMVIAGDADF